MYRPLIPMVSVMLFSLISSAVIFVILQRKSSGLANRIAAKNSRAINQMVRDMSAISRQEKDVLTLRVKMNFNIYLIKSIKW